MTTKPDGTGLGLALTKRVTEAHHGTIEAGRPGDGGAEFVITVPIAHETGDSLEVQLAAD